MTTNKSPAASTMLLDDLLWLHSRGASLHDNLSTAVDAMVAEYTADPDHYSDGSRVGTEYIPDYATNVILWGPLPPPHRRTAAHVDALAELIIQQGAIKFAELADYLETRGVNMAGDEALTGEHVNQPHVRAGTTLLCPVSTEYVEIVEALFNTRPVMLEIGDPACFASHEESWWVAWAGDPAALT